MMTIQFIPTLTSDGLESVFWLLLITVDRVEAIGDLSIKGGPAVIPVDVVVERLIPPFSSAASAIGKP